MKALKLLIVLLLVSWQANATGFSHNMLVAQKMLNTKQQSVCVKNQPMSSPLQLVSRTTIVKPDMNPATESAEEEILLKPEATAASLSQHIARWVVRIVTVGGKILTETLVAVFSFDTDSAFPTKAIFISLTNNVLSYLIAPLRAEI